MAAFSSANQFPSITTILLICFMCRCLATDSCGRGTFMYIPAKGRYTCIPCPKNTYMDEMKHLHEKCKPCPSQGNLQCPCNETPCYLIHVCIQGQYQDFTEECKSCKHGTFMDERQHNHNRCFDCAKPKTDGVERILQNCTLDHQTVIGCKSGYYRDNKTKNCKRCHLCTGSTPYVIKECDHFSDTLCCPHPNMTWTESSTGFKCRNASLLCPLGKYLSTSHKCLPCPATETEREKNTKRNTDIKEMIPTGCQNADYVKKSGSEKALSNFMSFFLTIFLVPWTLIS